MYCGLVRTTVKMGPLMTIPRRSDEIAAEEMERRETLRRLDRVYGCYAFLGLAMMAIMAVDILATPEGQGGTQEGWGMALGALLALPLPIVLVATIVWTLKLRRNWQRHRMILVLGLSTLFLAGAMAIDASEIFPAKSNRAEEYAGYAVVGIYAVAATLVPAWWFTRGRRRV